MISLEEAYKIVLSHVPRLQCEQIRFEESVGRVLAVPIVAGRDLPPFDRVAMDGIAIRFDSFSQGKRVYEIVGTIAAGDPISVVSESDVAIEIMTGAPLPSGVDTVIRYEDLKIEEGRANILVEDIHEGQNIHHCGKDNKAGDILIPAGHRIRPTDISMLASEGLETVEVRKPPSFGIVSSGDELVPVAQIPQPHQIRISNVYAIQALLYDYHPSVTLYHLKDDKEHIRTKLTKAFRDHEVIILVGGVSKGKFDFIPEVLEEMGAVKHFHGVAQRPGKPFWFGQLGEKAIFALPGNPVSSMVGTTRYVLPWLRKAIGLNPDFSFPVVLGEEIEFRPKLTRLVEAAVEVNEKGTCIANPQIGHGSGDFTRLVFSRGFLELPAEPTLFEKGEIYRFWKTDGYPLQAQASNRM